MSDKFQLVLDSYLKSLTTKNADILNDLFFDEDSVMVFPNAEVAIGSEEIIAAYKAWYADSDWSCSLSVESDTCFDSCRSVFWLVSYSDADESGKPYEMEFYLSAQVALKNGDARIAQVQTTLIH